MKKTKEKKMPWAVVIVMAVVVVLLVAGIIVARVAYVRQQEEYAANSSGGPHIISGEETGESIGNSEEKETETTAAEETQPEVQTLHFVDAHDNWYDVPIDPAIEKHPYDLKKFNNDQTVCTYEDDVYTSRLGIDVSSHQGGIDWNAVSEAGIKFVFVRIGYRGYGPEGTLMVDDMGAANIAGAQEAGLDVGVYFFSQAVNEEEAVEEADLVLSILEPFELQLPVVFDPEHILDDDARTDDVTGEQFTKNAVAFCERIKAAGSYDTAIYSNMKWEAFTYDLKQLTDYPIWYADYEPLPQTPYRFSWWQYSEKGAVPGVDGIVDLDMQILPK